jgi:hypothetical protein
LVEDQDQTCCPRVRVAGDPHERPRDLDVEVEFETVGLPKLPHVLQNFLDGVGGDGGPVKPVEERRVAAAAVGRFPLAGPVEGGQSGRLPVKTGTLCGSKKPPSMMVCLRPRAFASCQTASLALAVTTLERTTLPIWKKREAKSP